MGNLFNIEGKVYHFMEKLANIMGASLLWTLFSLPIFTVGASTTALYWTVCQVIRKGNGGIWKTFWATFKGNFKQSTILWLILLLSCAFLILDGYCCYVLYDAIPILKWILVLLALLVVFLIMWSLYWFPYIAHIQDSLKAVVKNTLIMCVFHFLHSLSMLVAFGLCIWAFFAFSLSPALLALLPGGYMYFSHIVLKQVFSRYWDTEEPQEVDNT